MNNTQILSSLQVMRPELESYYTQWSSKLVSSALNELGENLKGIYNSWTFSSVKEVIFHNCDTFLRDDFRFIDQINAKGYKFSQEKAAKNAVKYADSIIESYAAKIISKLGTVESASLTWSSTNFEFILEGVKNGETIAITQRMKYNVSKLGKPFCQFPAICYVAGKKISAADYKKSFA
jgi:hypothetical protein